ncbi:TIGR03617 family F420-dependent LLM class oxidoreductase [Microbacterium sp. ZXX196]|uniref:TIGR03617 family F420-dependent LLM class oxidoreductase n=1 Tax=Microbacterium sp. ZXX196 TaxID=2609291 RepID=UPI0012B88915|nr:TIGR03617 family F420-dependent LLM class oxidoreductase [Microbacterium sp. ZXX196]MTE24794.1 TIGR03617 family F420-dependent LLM class oxidoreductase [Microbacterium sp. ZXX196]
MRIDIAVRDASPRVVTDSARLAEADGYDGIQVPELAHDPLVACALAAAATRRIHVATSIAVAFARNPMTVAQAANDVQLAAEGRFALGLGSQVRPHIEKRFSMPWSAPAPRMREFIAAVRAIWTAWDTGGALDVRGEHYRHTLMTPMFSPGPNPFGPPDIWLAAVGPAMTALAGEAADGFIAHAFTTPAYLAQVSLPALAQGRERSGRARTDVVVSPFVVTGQGDVERAAAERAVRSQIAFYASTPSYRPVMELHGWEDAADALHAASRRGEWERMGALVTDDMMAEFAIACAPGEVRGSVEARFGSLADRASVALG